MNIFDNIFNTLDPKPVNLIDEGFKRAAKDTTTYAANKQSVAGLDKVYERAIGVTYTGFKLMMDGLKGSSNSRSYIAGILKTEGDYSNRDAGIRKVENTVYKAVKTALKNTKDNDYQTVFHLYTRVYDIINNKSWDFSKLYKLYKRDNKVATVLFSMYVYLAYTLEYLTSIFVRDYMASYIDSGKILIGHETFCNEYSTFVRAVCKPMVRIVTFCETTKDPRKTIDSIIRIDKDLQLARTEEGYVPLTVGIDENTIGNEDFGMSIIFIMGAGLLFVGTLACCRGIHYHIECLKIDIAKSLIEQSDIIVVGLDKLESKRDSYKEGSKEYKEMDHIISKQRSMVELANKVADKLSSDDLRDVSNIRDADETDSEIIRSESDKSSSDDYTIEI